MVHHRSRSTEITSDVVTSFPTSVVADEKLRATML